MFRFVSFALAAFSILTVLNQAQAAKSECRCRKAKNGVYLELITYKNDDSMKISALESFTMKENAQNLANCQAEIKTRPACGGVAPKVESTAKVYTIRIDPKQMNESFYKIGLLPGDQVLSIDKKPVASPSDLNKIHSKAENGGRVDIEVQRKDSTLDLWYEFPKPEPAS